MQPDRIKVGAGVVLVSVSGVCQDWGVTEKGLMALLSTFQIPTIRFPGGEKRYISLWSLERCLFEVGLPGALRGTQSLVSALHESAGLMYQTATRETIHERIKALAREIRTPGPHSSKRLRKS